MQKRSRLRSMNDSTMPEPGANTNNNNQAKRGSFELELRV